MTEIRQNQLENMTALDLYCGIGGWSLGLELADVKAVEAIDISAPAIETYFQNLGLHPRESDIRTLDMHTLRHGVEIIVGSPPCTQFSFSNRGGAGNLVDGIADLRAFLSVVRHLEPRFWAMENVPRVAGILKQALEHNGELEEFADLVDTIAILDFADFGVPQKRKRCIAGNFPFELLMDYTKKIPRRTLGDVLSAFDNECYSDFLYGAEVPLQQLSDHIAEGALTGEEIRLNLEAKIRHPVYNGMRFPDQPDRPARTLTATCTKVSRESIIIEKPPNSGLFRRLTIRERACLQGFPARFGIFASSYSAKIRLIGNAIPPPIGYYIACAMQGVPSNQLQHPWERGYPSFSEVLPPSTPPRQSKHQYPAKRRFRAAIPGLRLKSGTRFQLSNNFENRRVSWVMDFRFGTPKDIRILSLDDELLSALQKEPLGRQLLEQLAMAGRSSQIMSQDRLSYESIQRVWTHTCNGIGPFQVLDELGELGQHLIDYLQSSNTPIQWSCLSSLVERANPTNQSLPNAVKLRENKSKVLVGITLGCWFNHFLAESPEALPLEDHT